MVSESVSLIRCLDVVLVDPEVVVRDVLAGGGEFAQYVLVFLLGATRRETFSWMTLSIAIWAVVIALVSVAEISALQTLV